MTDDKESHSTLLTHLLELRRAVLISASSVGAAFCAIFFVFIDYLMSLITRPIQAKGITIIYTAMSEVFITKFKVSLIAAVVIASPVIIWQIWSFIKPGLYPNEQKNFRVLFFVALILFLAGVAFCYSAVYWLAVDFFLIQGAGIATPMLSIDKYVGFLFSFILPFGCAFQLPVAIYLMAKVNLTSYKSLAQKRKYILLAIFTIAAILTPPDVISQIALGIPLYALYEIGIQTARFVKPRQQQGDLYE